MAKTYSRLNIDVNGNILSCVTGVQLDLESRYLDVSLFSNSTAIDLTGQTVRMLVKKPPESGGDGTISYIQGEITDAVNGRCQFELTNQILAVVGAVTMQIEIWNGTSVLSTHQFNFYVLPTLRNDEEIESTNEYGALVVLFQEIQNALDLMKKMTDSFGLPGQKAEEFGVSTFWGMMEILAERADTKGLLKQYINGTIDTASFKTLDVLVKEVGTSVSTNSNSLAAKVNTLSYDMKTGGVPIIRSIQRGVASAGGYTVALIGFTNVDKMIVLLNGGSTNGNPGDTAMPYVASLSTTQMRIDGGNSASVSYQVIEFY